MEHRKRQACVSLYRIIISPFWGSDFLYSLYYYGSNGPFFFCFLCIFFLFPHTAVTLQLYKPCPSIRPLTIQSGRKQQLKCFRCLGSIQQLAPQRIQSANLNEKERGVKGKRRKKREEKEKLRKEIKKSKEIK